MKKLEKHQKTVSIEAHTATKRAWVMVLFIFFTLFLVGTASAMNWDNVKSYDAETETITIINAFGLGEDIAELKLNTPHNYQVPRGYQKVAEIEIEAFDNYTNVFNDLSFYNLNNNFEKIDRNFDYKYKVSEWENINDYELSCFNSGNGTQSCEQVIIGTHKEKKNVWYDLDTSILFEEKITIGIFTDVQKGDDIEWVPKLFGVEIDEWASWTESLNSGLVAYYSFDHSSGTNLMDNVTGKLNGTVMNMEDADWQAGKIGYSLRFDTTADEWVDLTYNELNLSSDQTRCVWAKIDADQNGVGVIMNQWAGSFYWNFEANGSIRFLTGSGTLYTSNVTDNTWHYHCMTSETGNTSIWVDGIIVASNTMNPPSQSTAVIRLGGDGSTVSTKGWYDELEIWNRTLTISEISDLYNNGDGIGYKQERLAPTITLNFPIDNYNSTLNSITFNGTVIAESKAIFNVSLIINDVYNETNTSGINNTDYIFDKILADGTYTWTYEACDNESLCGNATARTLNIDSIGPFLNLTAPSELIDFGIFTVNETLNWNVSDPNIDSCWFNYNSTNTTVTCADNTTSFELTSQKNLTFYANDTLGHLVSNFTTWDYKVFQNSITFNNETYEMETEIFSINTSSNGSEITLGYLIYNGTSYLATKTGTNYDMEFNRTITLNQKGNVSFYWSFNYGEEIINTSTYYQNVSEIMMGFCGGSLVTQTLNFTAYVEEDMSRLISYDFYGTFEYWTGDGSITKSFSVSNSSINETLICININNTFYSDAKIQYEKDGFVKRNYYLINEPLTNSSQDKELFLLNTSASTSFIIEVTDEVQLPITDVYIYIQRYYPGTDQYKTVGMALTDGSGSTIGHFEAETEDYRLVFEKDGIILYQSGTQKIFCRETPCTLTFQTVAGAGITWDDFGIINQFDWTLDYEDSTEVWTLTYTDTSSSIGYGRLHVYYEDPVDGKVTICNTTSSQLADTITCDVTGYNGTIYAAAYLSRSPEILVYLKSIVISALKQIFSFEGLFLMMFVLMILGLAGLWNPAVGIILTLGGIIVFNIIGIASFGAVTIWGLVLIGGILLWELKT